MKENNNAPAFREPSTSNNPSEQKKNPKISRRVLLAGSVGVGVAAASGLYGSWLKLEIFVKTNEPRKKISRGSETRH